MAFIGLKCADIRTSITDNTGLSDNVAIYVDNIDIFPECVEKLVIIGQMKADDVTIADYRTKCSNTVDGSLKSRKSFLESDIDHLYNLGYSILYDKEKGRTRKWITKSKHYICTIIQDGIMYDPSVICARQKWLVKTC
jgi:hypothetical protein